jgi:superfamily II DNA or RNA helicase
MEIEKYLILNKYFLSLFGVKDFDDLRKRFKNVKEDIDSDGRTYFANTLLSLRDLKIEDDLIQYDRNIQEYIREISKKRGHFKLKYFQYLAVLFTEIFLDFIKNRKVELINKLNDFLRNYKDSEVKELIGEFKEDDFKKLAFWMATGSGKTLIAHINYLQFIKYKPFEPDNILLITPNLNLSKQHLEELQKSGIPAKIYSEGLVTQFRSNYEILIIEITKLVEEKKGGGISLPVETFEGKNLIFVNEEHKGKKSDDQKWAKLRNKLIEKGFAFEYSATFGQILDKNNTDILKEYSKAIIFDYSYKYFYLDGYGKDFWVFNIEESKKFSKDFQEITFIANLLDFYEQLLLYQKEKNDLCRKYNIEKPLWIFVGTSVTGKKLDSDVLQIVEFIKKVLSDENCLKQKIEKILKGEYKDEKGKKDIFENKFSYLRSKIFTRKDKDIDIGDLYDTVFHGKGKLKICELKNIEGELGLKVGENPYFGVINIGNVSDFKKLLEQQGFSIDKDIISNSLFEDIKKENSMIHILIGSKKFIEGWDTWRASSMGLLHIGKGEGPQIIQLFGRGVRLKGENMSLKRSENEQIKPLEILNIYGVKADYIKNFLSAISKEEVEFEEIKIPVKVKEKNKWEDLPYLIKDEKAKFEEENFLNLFQDDKLAFILDLGTKISVYIGERKNGKEFSKSEEIKAEMEEKIIYDIIPDIDLLNWQKIFKEILEYKTLKGYWNLCFSVNNLKDVLKQCKVKAYSDSLKIQNKQSLEKIEEIAILLLKGYIDKFYRKQKGLFEKDKLTYKKAGEQLELFKNVTNGTYEYYTVCISKNNKKKEKIIQEIKEFLKKINDLQKDDDKILPRIVIENSIFIPLILKNDEIDKISPPGLTESEKKFVSDLKKYLQNNKLKYLSKCEIVLLRNEVKSGIGFQLDWASFYPDFIMWIKEEENKKIHIVFIDPKGLHHTQKLQDERVNFMKQDIKEIEKKIQKTKEKRKILLHGFILSYTKYEDLIKNMKNQPSKEEFESKNVLFLKDNEWTEKLFKKILTEDI